MVKAINRVPIRKRKNVYSHTTLNVPDLVLKEREREREIEGGWVVGETDYQKEV